MQRQIYRNFTQQIKNAQYSANTDETWNEFAILNVYQTNAVLSLKKY